MTIVEFLLNRIGEDEGVADRGGRHNASTVYANDDFGCLLVDPARVLAECEAKRRIVENESRARAYRSPRWIDAMNDEDRVQARKAEVRVGATDYPLRLLAAIYADHSDYDERWAA